MPSFNVEMFGEIASVKILLDQNVDAKDEIDAIKIAHKMIDEKGYSKENRVLVRVRPIYVLNRRMI